MDAIVAYLRLNEKMTLNLYEFRQDDESVLVGENKKYPMKFKVLTDKFGLYFLYKNGKIYIEDFKPKGLSYLDIEGVGRVIIHAIDEASIYVYATKNYSKMRRCLISEDDKGKYFVRSGEKLYLDRFKWFNRGS